MLYFILVCLIVYIPHTSIQDELIPKETLRHSSRRAITTVDTNSIESLIKWLTEKQYQYEAASYALTLKNVFPNFAKLFHERSEDKYNDVKGLIRLCQVLNFDINLTFISSSAVNDPLTLLSPDRINKTNFAQFFSDLKTYECKTMFSRLKSAYHQAMTMSVPLQMYLKEKLFMKQVLTCKITSDLYAQVDRFIEKNSADPSIPFSLMYFDSRAKLMFPK